MNICYVDKMSKISARSFKISAQTEFKGIGASKITYFFKQVVQLLP